MIKSWRRASFDPHSPHADTAGSLRQGLRRLRRGIATLILDFTIIKPIAIFVWAFSQRKNEMHFRERGELLDRIERARAEGHPVVIAANHVSWFDDPVIPMTLYRTGQRAIVEFVLLGGFVATCWLLPQDALPPPARVAATLAAATAIALYGARKDWWTLGDSVNLSDASVLRGKFELTRKSPPGPLLGFFLSLADSLIPWFMQSGSTKTVWIDRRPGEEAKHSRARALATAVDLAERLEPIWVFFEGGRSKLPGIVAPARRGIGSIVSGLRERGLEPVVVVVYHHGMERLIPPGGSRFLSSGHRVDVRWQLFDVDSSKSAAGDDQAIADAVRETAVGLQTRIIGEADEEKRA